MEADERLELVQEAQGKLWEAHFGELHKNRKLYDWISTYHPDKLPCYLAQPDLFHGSYNIGCKIIFEDATKWWVRFPQAGKIHSGCADEKVVMEVAAVNLIRRETTVLVPEVKAWDNAAQCPLELGPFIMMDFIENSAALNKSLRKFASGTRLLTDDITDDEIETIHRQFTNILLQLWRLDFDRIGNFELETPLPRYPARPLTWKYHEIIQRGGVNALKDTDANASSQRNTSIMSSSRTWCNCPLNQIRFFINMMPRLQTLKTLIPKFIHKGYNQGKPGFICDDLGLANLMVKSREDLTIVGVVDLEWSYAGPAQMAASAPWWLLMNRPTDEPWDCFEGEPVEIAARYFKYLGIFKRVLKEEELKTPGPNQHEYSDLVQWSQDSGAMWLHMTLATGFNDPELFPFFKLRQYVGEEEWKALEGEIDEDEVEAFVEKKLVQLEQYTAQYEAMKAQKGLVDNGTLSMEEFVASYTPRREPLATE